MFSFWTFKFHGHCTLLSVLYIVDWNFFLFSRDVVVWSCLSSFLRWTTSGPSWCRQWRKPIRSTLYLVGPTASWFWRDPCSSRPILASCPSSTMKPSWATQWPVARLASKNTGFSKLQEFYPCVRVTLCYLKEAVAPLKCNAPTISECKLSPWDVHTLVSETSGQPTVGEWCTTLHGLYTHLFVVHPPLPVCQTAAHRSAIAAWALRSDSPCDISWRERTQHLHHEFITSVCILGWAIELLVV